MKVGMTPVKSKYRWVSANTSGDGRTRWRFRRKGFKTCYLPGWPGYGAEFEAAYDAALQIKIQAKTPTTRKFSISHAIALYRASETYEVLKSSTKISHSRLLGRVEKAIGDKSVITLKASDLRKIFLNIESVHTRNRIRSLLCLVLDECVEEEWIDINVARMTKKKKAPRTDGFHSWTSAERAQFKDCWAEGTMERLAYCLLYFLAQRGIDTYTLGPRNIENGMFKIRQEKTNTPLYLPISSELKAELARHKTTSFTFINKKNGIPYKKKSFQQWFSHACTKAGLPHCSAHGLRKSRAARIAESDGTVKQIMAITGHKTLSQAQAYIDKADQRRLAIEANNKVEKNRN